MSAPEKPDPEDSKRNSDGGLDPWPPILFFCGVIFLAYVASELEAASPGAGRSLFLWVLGIGAVSFIAYVVWGSSLRETASNIAGFSKAVLSLLLIILVIGSIGRCMGGDSGSEPSGLGGVPDQWRKP